MRHDPDIEGLAPAAGELRVRRDPAPAVAPPCDWDLVAGQAGPRRRPHRRRGVLRLVAALPLAAASVAGLTLLAAAPSPPEAGFRAATVLQAPPPAWTALGPQDVRLRLAPEDGVPLVATARASTGLGLREDGFVLGRFAQQESAFLRLVVTTPLADGAGLPDAGESPFVALARRAAEADGLALGRLKGRTALPIGLGTLDLLDLVLTGEGTRPCTGLRLQRSASDAVAVEGYVCGPEGSLPEPASLACLLDRLTLVGSAPSAVVDRFAGPAGRSGCRTVETTASTRAAPAGANARSPKARFHHVGR